jgi:hypothetical protein
MKNRPSVLTEDELDVAVSVAIHRAEILDDMQSPKAAEAWHEVMLYEERLAWITPAGGITGGIARVGAVRAALAAGRKADAERLASQFLAEAEFSSERRAALDQVFEDSRGPRACGSPLNLLLE